MRLIDADAAKEQIKRRENLLIPDDDGLKRISTNVLYVFMDNRPTVDAEPVKHGHWVKVRWVETPLQPDEGYWIVRCSACHIPNCSTFRYCPHCGAKMDEEAGDEDTVSG